MEFSNCSTPFGEVLVVVCFSQDSSGERSNSLLDEGFDLSFMLGSKSLKSWIGIGALLEIQDKLLLAMTSSSSAI